jgi:predicted small integral membrane protein
MNAARALEYRITRSLTEVRPGLRVDLASRVAERLIKVLAATAVVALLGAVTPELLWAGLAASVVFALGLG